MIMNRASSVPVAMIAAARRMNLSGRLALRMRSLFQRRRIYMHKADMAVDAVLSPAYDRAWKRLRKAKALLGIGPAVPARWGEQGCKGLNDFHRAPVKGFVLPADVAAYRSGGDSNLSMQMSRILNSRRGEFREFRFVPGTLPAILEEEEEGGSTEEEEGTERGLAFHLSRVELGSEFAQMDL